MATIQSHLAANIYFQDMSEADLEWVCARCLLRRYSNGTLIFLEGDVADGLWIVETGHVKVFKVSPQGSEHILHLCGPGTTFNDIAALDGGLNPASASALSQEVAVWLVPAEVIQEMLRRNPAAALTIIRLLAARVRSLVTQIEDLALHAVIARLARLLLRQAEDPSLSGPGVTRAALAAHINTTPQTISQLLRSLEAAGAIVFDRQHVLIVDEGILRSIAQAESSVLPIPGPGALVPRADDFSQPKSST